MYMYIRYVLIFLVHVCYDNVLEIGMQTHSVYMYRIAGNFEGETFADR